MNPFFLFIYNEYHILSIIEWSQIIRHTLVTDVTRPLCFVLMSLYHACYKGYNDAKHLIKKPTHIFVMRRDNFVIPLKQLLFEPKAFHNLSVNFWILKVLF